MADKIDENIVPEAAKEVVNNPTAMGAAGLMLGIGSEAIILSNNRKKPFDFKKSLVVGTCAGAVGILGSSLINAMNKTKDSQENSWVERMQSEDSNDLGNSLR